MPFVWVPWRCLYRGLLDYFNTGSNFDFRHLATREPLIIRLPHGLSVVIRTAHRGPLQHNLRSVFRLRLRGSLADPESDGFALHLFLVFTMAQLLVRFRTIAFLLMEV